MKRGKPKTAPIKLNGRGAEEKQAKNYTWLQVIVERQKRGKPIIESYYIIWLGSWRETSQDI